MSHYCEKARWALNRAGVPFTEEKHLQGFHYLYTYRYARSAFVPIFVTEEALLRESSDILEWADGKMSASEKIYPEDANQKKAVKEFVRTLDEVFGPAGRLWMYTYMFNFPDVLLEYSIKHGVPALESRMMPFMFPLFRSFARRRLKWGGTSRTDSKLCVDRVFAQVASKLENGQRFLFGEKFSAADLTFAALAAPVILPELYGVVLPKLDELPREMAEQVMVWREHIAGKFALRLYQEHR